MEKTRPPNEKRVMFAPLPKPREGIPEPTASFPDDKGDSDSYESFYSGSDDDEEQHKLQKEVNEAKNQWEQVDKQQSDLDNLPTERGVGGKVIDRSTPITYYDAQIYIKQQSVHYSAKLSSDIVTFQSKNCYCIPINAPKIVTDTYIQICKCAKIEFKEGDLTHHRILNSLHASITGISVPPPRKSKIWEDIGFQSKDPISDLRATGILGLLLPLGMFSRFKTFGKQVVQLSRSPDQPFPLMLILINYVNAAIRAGSHTDMFLGAATEQEVWDRVLYYFTGMVSTLIKRWYDESLDFNSNFEIFDRIAATSIFKVSHIIAVGRKANELDNQDCQVDGGLLNDTSRL